MSHVTGVAEERGRVTVSDSSPYHHNSHDQYEPRQRVSCLVQTTQFSVALNPRRTLRGRGDEHTLYTRDTTALRQGHIQGTLRQGNYDEEDS